MRKLAMTVYGKNGRIYIGREVIRALGQPANVRLLVNREKDSIAVVPCTGEDAMSFPVPEPDKMMWICSKAFVGDILSACHLERGGNYSMEGTFSESAGAVIFDVRDSAVKM